MVRNLLYNCCALLHSEEWKLNIEELSKHEGTFNGRRLVLVKYGEGLHDPGEVSKYFFDAEFVFWPNDPQYHEVAGFLETLERLRSLREDEITFYAHTKGVRYGNAPEPHMAAIRRWRRKAYRECLQDVERIERVMSEHACAGCFRSSTMELSRFFESPWAFFGNFWWVKHSDLFQRDWRNIRKARTGVEEYLGKLFYREESHCFWGDNPEHSQYEIDCFFWCEKCGKRYQGKTRIGKGLFELCTCGGIAYYQELV